MRSIFNIFFLNKVVVGLMNSAWTICKQYVNRNFVCVNSNFVSYLETCASTTKKEENAKRRRVDFFSRIQIVT